MKNLFLQESNIDFITNYYGKELWIQVCGSTEINKSSASFWSCLVHKNDVLEELKNDEHEQWWECVAPAIYGNNESGYTLERYSDRTNEPLLFYRTFDGIEDFYIEISEEFRLLNNLHYNKRDNSYDFINSSGEAEKVIKLEKDNVYIKLGYLKRYATVKNMAIALYFDIRFDSDINHDGLGLAPINKVFSSGNYYFTFYSGDDDYALSERKAYSVIHGKKLIFPSEIEECGYYPFEKEKIYQEFIIGVDDNGNEITHSCNPNILSNNFNDNGNPHYLKLIYFTKNVLTKYYSKTDLYEVKDGHIRCKNSWLLQIDNLNKDYVSVYLGDLGRDLPEKEQIYWKSFNIVHDGKLSSTKFERDFMAVFSNPDIADMRFKQYFVKFKTDWKNKFNWDFFLDLQEGDEYNFEHLRIPINNTQSEFDYLILSLVKTIIDSINEKAIKEKYPELKECTKSIILLEQLFIKFELDDFNEHIVFLRNLQGLRSTGTGHRKGSNYKESAKKFKLNEKSFETVFEEILNSSYEFLVYLEEKLLNKL